MYENSLEISFLSLFSLITFFIFLIIQKFSKKLFNGKLLDNNFNKPQAFHKEEISRCGGLASIISLIIFIYLNNFFFSQIFYEYFIIGIGMFLIGFLDDLKINIKPIIRLILMILILSACIAFFSINIQRIDLIFLNTWMKNEFFLIFFILLCFLFIINGANLIDGFNGLLAINLLILNLILVIINLQNNSSEYLFLLIAQIIILITFILFNFPKAKIFFGDSGSYLFGSLLVLNVIYTNNFVDDISSFYFCILLSYIFFEVFFSFFRKIYLKKSPLEPDNFHLHMMVFKNINKKYNNEETSNYKTSIIINLSYLILITPAFFFKDEALLCKIWFIMILIVYIFAYYRLTSKLLLNDKNNS